MKDLYHFIGADLNISSTGDLQPVETSMRGQQRILRRLLTNPGDYIFHPEYGAGLPGRVGQIVDIPKIRALIRGQIMLEEAVSKTHEPVIEVQQILGGISVSIRYNDAKTNAVQTLSFDVSK